MNIVGTKGPGGPHRGRYETKMGAIIVDQVFTDVEKSVTVLLGDERMRLVFRLKYLERAEPIEAYDNVLIMGPDLGGHIDAVGEIGYRMMDPPGMDFDRFVVGFPPEHRLCGQLRYFSDSSNVYRSGPSSSTVAHLHHMHSLGLIS